MDRVEDDVVFLFDVGGRKNVNDYIVVVDIENG
jgi:hypothetical protein